MSDGGSPDDQPDDSQPDETGRVQSVAGAVRGRVSDMRAWLGRHSHRVRVGLRAGRQAASQRIREYLVRLLARILGTQSGFTRRLLTLVMVASVALVLFGVFKISSSQISTDGTSLWLFQLLDTVFFNLWFFLFVAVLLAFRVILLRDYLEARKTAKNSRFSAKTVRWLREEMKSTKGTTRVIATEGVDASDLEGRIRTALHSGVDELPGADPPDTDADATDAAGELPAGETETLPTPHANPTPESDEDSSLRDEIRMWGLDLATSFDTTRFTYRFLRPFLLVAVVGLLAVQLWTSLIVYALILGVSLLVATVYYRAYMWWSHRKLSKLRQDESATSYSECAALVKTVETPEVTAYMGWVAGHTYACYDEDRFCRVVADRLAQRVNDDTMAPSILEKFARNIATNYPMLRDFEMNDLDEGRPAIIDDIFLAVNEHESPDGIVPKRHLVEMVVEQDDGMGHDPDLIAEEYREMVPTALLEEELTVTRGDGEQTTMVAVHRRDEALPDDLAKIRAQFSESFDPDSAPKYTLPDVEIRSAAWQQAAPADD